MAQSSIEWYAKETAKITLSALRGGMTATEHRVLQDAALIKAKEMHKEEIEDAYDDGSYDEYEYHINNYPRKISEDYYNEKFNK